MNSRQLIICLSSPSCLFLFYSLVIFLSTITIFASYSGNETDHLALLSFKSMITQDPYGALTAWNISFHFCYWTGVTCGKRHRRVTVVSLNSQGLQGSLSPHVGNLSFLRELSLLNNSFQGEIPHEIGRLSRLRLLVLESNEFYGVIPTNLSGCSILEELSLGNNNLVGSIPKEISSISKLMVLSVGYNKLTGGIPPFLGNITSMEVFSASRNPLGGSIPRTVGHLKRLRVFRSIGCNLNGTIPYSIYNLSFLTKFSLPENQLTGSLPPNIGVLFRQLVTLQLRNNQLTGVIPPSISNCSKLGLLEMSINNFKGKVTIDFSNLRDIYTIALGNNNLYGRGEADDMKFIDSVQNCSQLLILELANSRLEGEVPRSIGNLSDKLQYINLAENQLTGRIPATIGNLVGLSTLHLAFNRFTGKIPSTIGKLQNLQVASFSENRLLGPIPDILGNLSFLTKLSLASNRLEGHIPSSLGNCHNLLGLDLSNNKLSGKIPKQLLQLSSLSIVLNLSNNNLFGSLPSEVGGLKMLSNLDLTDNNLSGSIPSSLGFCTSLSQLSLKGNSFQGMIPSSFSSLRGVVNIDLSHNNLSGSLYPFLKLYSLRLMDVSFNDFEGEVPVKGVFANASAFWIVGNSRLCGGLVELGLPKCYETKKHNNRFPLFVIVILIASSLLVFFVLVYVYAWSKKKRSRQPSQSSRTERFLKVSYSQLLKATDGFSEANLIGEGGFSSVYKGTLDREDRVVAVKVLRLQNRGAHRSFIAECEAWRSIRHRNLLKIITSCSSVDYQGNDFKALVYEFMPNGSLNDWLHSNTHTSRLNLLQRISVLIDIASALDYLHNQCLPSVVHCDLKPSNILLDGDMVSHVGDFGLARFLGANSDQNSSTGVKGTVGYAPPEYGVGSEMTSSGDVYSFGILLLEVMTGKKPTDDIFNEGLSLHKFASRALPDHVTDIIDDDAINTQSTEANAKKVEECLISTIKIGVSCSVDSPPQRMNIDSIVIELQRILLVLQNI